MATVQQIKDKIEELKHRDSYPYDKLALEILSELESFIDSHQEEPQQMDEEPVSEDLKEEATRLFGDCKVRKGAFYLGAQCQKEQMLKNVVLETTIIKDWDGCAEDGNYSEWLAYEDDEVINMPEWCEEGDKVKMILIKGD